MPQVRFTQHLRRFFPDLPEQLDVQAATAAEVVQALEAEFTGLASYLVDERGSLRPHVNIFIGSDNVTDRKTLSDPVGPDDEISIMQALSGGSHGT